MVEYISYPPSSPPFYPSHLLLLISRPLHIFFAQYDIPPPSFTSAFLPLRFFLSHIPGALTLCPKTAAPFGFFFFETLGFLVSPCQEQTGLRPAVSTKAGVVLVAKVVNPRVSFACTFCRPWRNLRLLIALCSLIQHTAADRAPERPHRTFRS